jgi:hypothetical protein
LCYKPNCELSLVGRVFKSYKYLTELSIIGNETYGFDLSASDEILKNWENINSLRKWKVYGIDMRRKDNVLLGKCFDAVNLLELRIQNC